MVDLSTPEAAASGTGTLSLILFEAQTVDDGYAEDDDHRVPRYVGGSGGAYEKFWKESTGAVVAVLNPQILKHRPVSVVSRSFITQLTVCSNYSNLVCPTLIPSHRLLPTR